MNSDFGKIVGLRGLLLILENEPVDKKFIIDKLKDSGICGIIDWRGVKLETYRNCEERKTVWLEEVKPLKNTGWSILSTKYDSSISNGSFIYYPNIYGTWSLVKQRDEEFFYISENSPIVVSGDDWDNYKLTRGSKRSVPVLPFSSKLEFTEDCFEGMSRGSTYWFCGEDLFILENKKSGEFYISRETTITVKKQVKNPRVYWLQPYAVVKDKLDESLSSNFISVEMPDMSVSAISSKGIMIIDKDSFLEIITRGPSYLSFSKRPNFAVLHRLRLLHETPIFTVSDQIPAIEIKPPTVLVRKLELRKDEYTWSVNTEISYPLDFPSNLRIRISPPFYISAYEVNGNIQHNLALNAIDFPLAGLEYLKFRIHIKKRALKMLKS